MNKFFVFGASVLVCSISLQSMDNALRFESRDQLEREMAQNPKIYLEEKAAEDDLFTYTAHVPNSAVINAHLLEIVFLHDLNYPQQSVDDKFYKMLLFRFPWQNMRYTTESNGVLRLHLDGVVTGSHMLPCEHFATQEAGTKRYAELLEQYKTHEAMIAAWRETDKKIKESRKN